MNRESTIGRRGARVAALVLLAASAALCQPQDVQGWNRIHWGMTVAEAREAFQGHVSDPRVANPFDALLIDRFIINDIQIGRITADAAVETEQGGNAVVAVRLRVTGPAGSALARTSAYATLKHLLIAKYGAPQNEDHSPYGNGGMDNRVLWLFPSTSITLRWSELPGGDANAGFVAIRYEALDRSALDML